MSARLRPFRRVRAIGDCCSDELATVLVFLLAGLDLSLWLSAKGLIASTGISSAALLLVGH